MSHILIHIMVWMCDGANVVPLVLFPVSSKEQETELLASCREEDLRRAELEDDEDEAISSEQQ